MQVPKAADLVADSLRRQIVRGTIGDGEELPPEAILTAQFGVSRPTLREALRVLETEGLIRVRRGARGGATAHRMSPDLVSRYAGLLLQSRGATLADVYHAQITFEPASVREVAETRSDESLLELRDLLEREREAIHLPDKQMERIEFHSRLIEISGNQTLILLSEMISAVLREATAINVPIGPDHSVSHAYHEQLVELIAQRDGQAAQTLWEHHLREATGRSLERSGDNVRLVDLLG